MAVEYAIRLCVFCAYYAHTTALTVAVKCTCIAGISALPMSCSLHATKNYVGGFPLICYF